MTKSDSRGRIALDYYMPHGITKMNAEEKIAENYLCSLGYENIQFEPDGNVPPDFSINNSIGVEVRRLNQHFFQKDSTVGLELLEIPILDAFIEVLRSFDENFQGESFWLALYFERPLEVKIEELKTQMKEMLTSFLKTKPSSKGMINIVL